MDIGRTRLSEAVPSNSTAVCSHQPLPDGRIDGSRDCWPTSVRHRRLTRYRTCDRARVVTEGVELAFCARDPAAIDRAIDELQQTGGAWSDFAQMSPTMSNSSAPPRTHGTSSEASISDRQCRRLRRWRPHGLESRRLVADLRAQRPSRRACREIRRAPSDGERHGAVVLISSVSGSSIASPSSYATAKAAETQLALILAHELADSGSASTPSAPALRSSPGADGKGTATVIPTISVPSSTTRFHTIVLWRRARLPTWSRSCFTAGSGINGANIAVDGGQNRAQPGHFWLR